MPFAAMTEAYAVGVSPPLQPWSFLSHDTICCTDSVSVNFPAPDLMYIVSICSVALNAQQEPHCCWSFTAVVRLPDQSIFAGPFKACASMISL